MKYISLFSGIEAASVAWKPLGWEPIAFSEVDTFCCKVLEKHYPDVPNLGDITKIDWSGYEADVVVGGSPCQSFSYAGKRRGLLDARGRLMLEFIRGVREIQPRWVVWENVPGALSQDGGEAFGTLLGALAEVGYCCAWRVLDARFFGLPQRRNRIFLVGHRRAGYPAAVLFDPAYVQGVYQTSDEKWKDCAAKTGKFAQETSLAWTQNGDYEVRFIGGDGHYSGALCANPRDTQEIYVYEIEDGALRNLTPVERERLQGFPDGWTDVDNPTPRKRREAIGNSMAVPVMRWIGERIQMVEEL